jgi:hypothetical protein
MDKGVRGRFVNDVTVGGLKVKVDDVNGNEPFK